MVRGHSQKESEPPASDLFDAVKGAKSDMQVKQCFTLFLDTISPFVGWKDKDKCLQTWFNVDILVNITCIRKDR